MVESVLGRSHIHFASFSSHAAAVDLADKRYEQARIRLEEALPALEARFGPQHARTRETYERLSQAWLGLGDQARSAEFQAKARGE